MIDVTEEIVEILKDDGFMVEYTPYESGYASFVVRKEDGFEYGYPLEIKFRAPDINKFDGKYLYFESYNELKDILKLSGMLDKFIAVNYVIAENGFIKIRFEVLDYNKIFLDLGVDVIEFLDWVPASNNLSYYYSFKEFDSIQYKCIS